MDIVFVIELNDRSHRQSDRIKHDMLVENGCHSANLPIIWIPAQKNYDIRLIHRQIKKEIVVQET